MKRCAWLLTILATMPVLGHDVQDAQTTPPSIQQAEPLPVPPDEQPPPEPTPEERDQDVADLEKKVNALSRLKVSGYLQAQYVHDARSRNELGGATETRNFDLFSVRRARVKLTYQVLSSSRFVLQTDIASSGVVLKDGYVELTEPWTSWKHTLTAGQFNWPFGFEITYSSSAREVPERSRIYRTLFPGERDRGVMLSGLGMRQRFRYSLGVVNGGGTTRPDDPNKRKDIVGRVSYTVGTLHLGASVYRGSDLVATSSNARGVEFDKQRQGFDFQWITPVPGLAIRGESITGRQAPSAGTTRTESFDVGGWYLYAIQNLGTRHQVVLRVDDYDANTAAGGDSICTLTSSYIFHWDAHSKVMVAYEMPKNEGDDAHDDVFTLRYQFKF